MQYLGPCFLYSSHIHHTLVAEHVLNVFLDYCCCQTVLSPSGFLNYSNRLYHQLPFHFVVNCWPLSHWLSCFKNFTFQLIVNTSILLLGISESMWVTQPATWTYLTVLPLMILSSILHKLFALIIMSWTVLQTKIPLQ